MGQSCRARVLLPTSHFPLANAPPNTLIPLDGIDPLPASPKIRNLEKGCAFIRPLSDFGGGGPFDRLKVNSGRWG